MASIASVSQAQLTNRRKKLRRARRIRSVQALWRSLFVGGLVSTLGWGITSSDLVIRQPEQIVIEGNHFLSAQAIRSLLPLSYPQSLLQVQPQALANSLESQGPIAEATVSRQLLPPGLTIQVKERKPVAVAIGTTSPRNAKSTRSTPQEGLLDEQGVWMPESSYNSAEHPFELPTLKVIGSSDRYRSYWSEVYQAVSHSPVQVFEIDWQNPANLILKTELGKVHFGPYSSRFAEQLAVLDRMRELPTHVNPSKIAYIDLTNPDFPAIQMIKGNDTARPTSH
jgi:cell division protein FtsQ